MSAHRLFRVSIAYGILTVISFVAHFTLVHVIITVVFTSPSPCLVESDVEPHSLSSSQVRLIDSPDLAIVKRACFPLGAGS